MGASLALTVAGLLVGSRGVETVGRWPEQQVAA